MIEVVYFALFGMVALFVYNIYLFFLKKETRDIEGALTRWKGSLLVFIVSLLLFFLYFGFTFNAIQQTSTWNFGDGSPDVTYTSNNYLDALSFFPMITAILLFNFIFLVVGILQEFKVFGRSRMRK
jgi:hypothetical protein